MSGSPGSRSRLHARLGRLALAGLLASAAGFGQAAAIGAADRFEAQQPTAPMLAGMIPTHCRYSEDALARAEGMLENVYRLGANVAVELPANLTWTEDPLHDRNWQFQLHSLQFVRDLLTAWSATADQRYLDRAIGIVQDWIADNPKSAPPSEFSWGDHSTAWRGFTLACLAETIEPVAWLDAALDLHATTLADPAFYVNVGNHALDQ